jgi:tRNA(Ile)-lysidine synthase
MASENLAALAQMDGGHSNTRQLSLSDIKSLNPGRLSNLIRHWLNINKVSMPSKQVMQHLMNELVYAKEDATPIIRWDNILIRRYQQTLYLLDTFSEALPDVLIWTSFPNPILHGKFMLRANASKEGLCIPPNTRIEIRLRSGGESIRWRGHTRSLKKLLQEWQIPPWERKCIPLIYINNQLAAVVGYAISDDYFGKNLLHVYDIISEAN